MIVAKLTPKQQLFVEEYLVDLNATQAAIRAGYSAKTAAAQGIRLLRNVNIQTAIQEAMKKRESRTEVTQDMVVKELAAIGFAKATDYASIEGPLVTIKPTAQLTKDQAAAIVGIEQGNFGIKVKLGDKVKALELLGKHLGMFDSAPESGEPVKVVISYDYGKDAGD